MKLNEEEVKSDEKNEYYKKYYKQKALKFHKIKNPAILNWVMSQNNFTQSVVFMIKHFVKLYGEQDIFEAIEEKYNKENKMENA